MLFLPSFNVFQRKTRAKLFLFFIFVVLSIYFSLEKLKLKGVGFVCYVAFRKQCFCLIKLENLNAVEIYIIFAHKFINRFKK